MNGSHERDQAVERLLRQSFKSPQDGGTPSCLDAETLAAWVDGGLASRDLELAESHVADCARCQSLVAAVVRTSAAVPEPAAAPRRWLAWLVPLTAAVAAVALWVAVPRGPDGSAPQPTDQLQAARAKASEPEAVPVAPQLQSSANLKKEQPAELRKDSGQLSAARPAAPPAAPGAAPPPAAASSALRDAAPPSGFVARQAAKPAQAGTLAEAAAIPGMVIMSPDVAVRWRIAGPVLEHSENGGSTWDAVPTPAGAALTAGAAPSRTVCWVVGRAGVVLLSTDGRTFSRVPFPDMTDLSDIRATDAQSATVTTADGRVFATTDGGATWDRR